MTPSISILLPTRGRTEQLATSIASLLDLADAPDQIEWMLGFDTDDQDSLSYFEENIAPTIDASGGTYTVLGFDPVGYERLNVYVNTLADHGTGDWLVFWNDDAVMKSQHWDTAIKRHTGRFCLQAFDTHKLHPYSIFPIVPKEWRDIVGHLSGHQLNDAWLSQIAWMLDIMVRIDIKVEHDRADLTGNNNDETFKKRRIYEGNPSDPRDFNYVSYRTQRFAEATKISQWLKERGVETPFFDAVTQGKQDPWEKMLASDVNKQMMRHENI